MDHSEVKRENTKAANIRLVVDRNAEKDVDTNARYDWN